MSIFLGNGDGALQTATTLSGAGGFAAHAVVGDFNGDGSLDLAVTSILDNVIALYLGNGDGTFRTRTMVAAGTAPSGIAAADFNGDGKLDLVVTNGSSGATIGHTITVLPGNGNGTFQP
ncbi:MAG: VCBS repeat-containing protein, partial [Betaproteobacteria bacterium]